MVRKELLDADIEKLDEWMSKGVLQNAGKLEVQPLDVGKLQNLIKRSIRRTNNYAAGPDGVPYAAYRKTLDLSARVLADALDHM